MKIHVARPLICKILDHASGEVKIWNTQDSEFIYPTHTSLICLCNWMTSFANLKTESWSNNMTAKDSKFHS